jgi:hypothetical protein
MPLITRRRVYASNYTSHRAVLNNKLLFWTGNDQQRTGKLWVSDGKTTSELLSHDGTVVSWRIALDSIRVGNQIVFSSFSEKAVKIFKTDGTKAGTREIYSYPNEVAAFVVKTMTNNRMAAFELNVAGKRIHLVTDLENTWEIDGSQFEYHDLYATSNDFYLIHSSVKNGMGYNYIYKIENGQLKLIELNKGGADAVNQQIFDNRIYFTLRNGSGQLNDICYSDAGSDKVNRIYTGPMSYLTRRGDYLIAGTMSGPDVKVYKASTAKLLGEFTDIHPVDYAAGNAVALWGLKEVVVIHNDQIITRKFTEQIEFMNAVPQGILINTGSSWYLYDPKRAKIMEIFKDKLVDFNMAGAGDQLFFVDSNDRHSIAWDISDEKRIDFPAGISVAKSLRGDLAIAYDYKGTSPLAVYSLEGNAPVRKYTLSGDFDYYSVSDANYLSTSTTATGYELARIDRDSIFRFPEIIKGPEGISLQEAFNFKGSVYAAAFTFSKGLQVWKMDEKNLTPDDDDELVVIRPELPRGNYLPDEIELNAYPNPVMNELNVDLKEGGQIRILDPKGYEYLKTVVQKNKTLDVKKLPAGEYILIYSGLNGHIVKKIVKL